ncbi:MAG: Abi family protein [Acetobacter sp.]|nr:Abi family protein [Acetobacter sp.]
MFEKIVGLHEFDRKLRSLLLQAIDCIEITLRARLARVHVKNHNRNPIAYLNPKNFHFIETKKERKRTKEENEKIFLQTIRWNTTILGYILGIFRLFFSMFQ